MTAIDFLMPAFFLVIGLFAGLAIEARKHRCKHRCTICDRKGGD